MKLLQILILALMATPLYAQIPAPGAEQSEPIILMNGRAHLGNGEVIENSAVAFENGKLTIVGDATTMKLDLTNFKVIDCQGKDIYPGLIAPNTQLGLIEIGAVRATHDEDEVGAMNPNIRSLIAYNTDSRVTTTVRSNGVMIAQTVPTGGRISGSSSVVQLDAWNWEDAAVSADDGIWVSWPNWFQYRGWWAEPGPTEKNKRYEEQVDELIDFLQQAKAYLEQEQVSKKNLKFEALRDVMEGEAKLYVRVGYVRAMLDALSRFKNFDEELQLVLVGARDAHLIVDELENSGVELILSETHRLPAHDHSPVNEPFETPGMLAEADITFCLSGEGFWQQRNLMFHAGTAVAHGMDYERAIQMITLDAAKVLGIDAHYGSLETGKSATVIVSSGDVLDMMTSHIEYAFIDGRAVNLTNKQKELYEKFSGKYGLE